MEKEDKKLIEDFRQRLINIDGRRLNWFHENRIKPVSKLTYSGLNQQLNGYAPISETVRNQINVYLQTA